MNKIISIGFLLLSFVAASIMARSIFFGGNQSRVTCEDNDYDCNIGVYFKDMKRKPPEFSTAKNAAIEKESSVKKNIGYVFSLPDYESAGMLRVLAEYSPKTRRAICNSEIKKALDERGAKIKNVAQKREFFDLLDHAVCNPPGFR